MSRSPLASLPALAIVLSAALPVHADPPRAWENPTTPPKNAPAQGTVLRVDLAAGTPEIVITWFGNQTRTFTVAPDTAFFRRDLNTNRVAPIQLQQIYPGDAVSLVVEVGGGPPPRGMIRQGEVLVREARGRVESLTGRTLALSNGGSFTVADNTRFIVGGRTTARAPDLAGRPAIVRVQPFSLQVVEVELTD